jgi:hypothetical protein
MVREYFIVLVLFRSQENVLFFLEICKCGQRERTPST